MSDRDPLRRRRLARAAATILPLAALVAACSRDIADPGVGNPPPDTTRAVASVALDASTLVVEEGETRRLAAIVKDAEGRVLTGRAIAWTTSDPAVATVAGEGSVRGVHNGVATIMAAVEGKVAMATVTVAGSYPYDLLFDAPTGLQNFPELYRLDIRTPGAVASRILSPAESPASDVTASPDGSRLAFVLASDGQRDIYVVNRDGSGLVRVTSSPDFDDQPSWSPDGTRLAFRRWNYIGVPHDVWVVDADGTGERNLTADLDGEVRAPSWSPALADGSRRIVFTRLSRGESGYLRARLYTMRDDGVDKRAITAEAERLDDEPAWSPDGATIAFTRTGGEFMGDIWLVNAAGGGERPLMVQDPPFEQHAPAWSPDGALVAFASRHEIIGNRSGDWQLYTVKRDGTGMVRRTSEPHDHMNPAFVKR